jgi:hypothetical protein
MKSVRSIRWLAMAGLVWAVLPGAASAQSTWNLYNGSSGGSGCNQNAANTGNFGNTWGCTGVGTAGTSLTASSFSTQNAASGANQQVISGSGTYYANAYLSDWGTSGFGSANRNEGVGVSSPNHAIDNIPAGGWDGVLLNFGATGYVLSSIGIGWAADANGATAPVDITVMRWTGSGAPTGSNSTVTTGANTTLAAAGWSLVGSYKDLTADSSLPFGGASRSTGATSASSWWLITAFNSALNGGTSCKTAAGAAATCDEGDDAFKLNYITTAASPGGGGGGKAPEPASLALVVVALLGASAARRGGLTVKSA